LLPCENLPDAIQGQFHPRGFIVGWRLRLEREVDLGERRGIPGGHEMDGPRQYE
jgi:hypothetical protein